MPRLLKFAALWWFALSFAAADLFLSASFCVLDGNTRQVLKSKEHLQPRAPASTVKLLTAIVVLDNSRLDQKFSVSEHATQVAPSKIYVAAGEEMSCRDLLIALLLKSANDCASVLAEGVAQSETEFVAQMNAKAKAIGCRYSRFATPHGLPHQGEVSCAYDLALIALEASRYPVIQEILKLKEASLTTTSGRNIQVKSHNRLLEQNSPVYGKTGYTKAAANTFAGFIEVSGHIQAVAIMGAPKRPVMWHELGQLVARTHEAAEPVLRPDNKTIQMLLKEKGYYEGDIDGVLGPASKAAIKKFQSDNNLRADGKVGPQTWEKLSEENER
jgi:D-alanyl-D-alanine carboxypeptidase